MKILIYLFLPILWSSGILHKTLIILQLPCSDTSSMEVMEEQILSLIRKRQNRCMV